MKKLLYSIMIMLGLIMMVSCGDTGQNKPESKEATSGTVEKQSEQTIVESVAEPTDTRPRVYAAAYDGFLNIRETPNVKAPVLGVFRNGPEGAVLLGTEGDWTKVDCDGIIGYVFSSYLQNTPTIAVDEGVDLGWLEGWWENEECISLLIFDNGGYMEYNCMFNEGNFVSAGAFRLQGSTLVLTSRADFVNWTDNPNVIETYTLDPVKKTIVGYKKQQLKTKTLAQYMKEEYGDEAGYWSYDDLYLTKQDFNELKKHIFDNL